MRVVAPEFLCQVVKVVSENVLLVIKHLHDVAIHLQSCRVCVSQSHGLVEQHLQGDSQSVDRAETLHVASLQPHFLLPDEEQFPFPVCDGTLAVGVSRPRLLILHFCEFPDECILPAECGRHSVSECVSGRIRMQEQSGDDVHVNLMFFLVDAVNHPGIVGVDVAFVGHHPCNLDIVQ